MLFVFDLIRSVPSLVSETQNKIDEVSVVVDAQSHLSEAFGRLTSHWRLSFQGRDAQSISQKQLFTQSGKLLHMDTQAGIRLLDQLLQIVDSLRSVCTQQILLLTLSSLDFCRIVTIRSFKFAVEIFLMLCSRLGSFQAKLARLFLACPSPVILLCQRIVFAFCLVRSELGILNTLLCIQAALLPVFPSSFRVRCQLMEFFRHYQEGARELEAMIGHVIVDLGDFSVIVGEGALSAFGSSYDISGASTESFQALRVFLFEDGSLLQESGKVLVAVSQTNRQRNVRSTLVELMLCLSLLNNVVIPI